MIDEENKTRIINAIFAEKNGLSYDVAVIQWITSCHKNLMTPSWRERVTSLTTSVSTMRFFY